MCAKQHKAQDCSLQHWDIPFTTQGYNEAYDQIGRAARFAGCTTEREIRDYRMEIFEGRRITWEMQAEQRIVDKEETSLQELFYTKLREKIIEEEGQFAGPSTFEGYMETMDYWFAPASESDGESKN
jgi:hypothetical protein